MKRYSLVVRDGENPAVVLASHDIEAIGDEGAAAVARPLVEAQRSDCYGELYLYLGQSFKHAGFVGVAR